MVINRWQEKLLGISVWILCPANPSCGGEGPSYHLGIHLVPKKSTRACPYVNRARIILIYDLLYLYTLLVFI